MILLWGAESDTPLSAVAAALDRRGAPVFRLDQHRAGETEIELVLAHGALGGELRVGAEACALADIAAAYVRPFETRVLLGEAAAADPVLAAHAARLDQTVNAFLDVSAARQVNPAAAMASNGSKPYQASLIARHGFSIPDTLVTTDRAAALDFRARHGEIIYKSVSGVRSIVSRLSDRHAERLEDIAWCPTQFQQYVPGVDHRVHVVGDRLFTCEIISEADDYRYAHRQDQAMSVVEGRLPDDVAARCRRLAAALGLAFAGVDLRRTPDGDWCCFEVNPSPAFTYYQDLTGLPIAEAVAALLVGDEV